MRRLLLIPVFGLALACQSPPPKADKPGQPTAQASAAAEPSPTPTPTSSEAEPGCEAAPLRTELQSYCEFDLGVTPLALPRVKFNAEPYHPLATRVITLTGAGLVDPEGGQEPVAVAAWLAEPPRRIPEPGELVFAIAADVPAATVAELLRGLADAGRERIRVLVHVADPRPIPQPRDPQMLGKMREALPKDPNQRVMFVAQAVQGYAQVCPPLAGVFPQLPQIAPGDRCAKLGELASKAIVECGCDKLPEIMTLLYALTIGFEPPTGRAAAVSVVLDRAAEPIAVGDASWGEIAGASFEDAGERRIWLEGAG